MQQSLKSHAVLWQAVEEVLHVLGLPGDEVVAAPQWHHEDTRDASTKHMSLRDALTLCYDLR